MTKRYVSTIKEYLNGCNCSNIYFSAGGCMLWLTNDWSESELARGKHTDSIPNDWIIIRHHDDTRIIELEICSTENHQEFYMTYPTATHIRTP